MTTERSELTARVLPLMVLGDGNLLAAPPPPLPRDVSPAARAQERFRITGNAIVTGGAGDLGLAVTRALLEHGVSGLMIFDVNPAEAEARVKALEAEFPGPVVIGFRVVDITDEDAVDAAVAETVKILDGPVSTLINLAGMVSCGHALDWTSKDWNRVMNVNTIGGFFVARAVARGLIKHKIRGSIIFVASCSGHRVNFPQPQVPYNTSKAAVIAMVRSLASEWAHYGIRVNSISPGYMDTILNDGDGLDEARKMWASRNPTGRMGQPDELSGAVVLLASRAGSYFNGTDLLIDGGQTLLM
ncbi:oxidoreductase-like protein [Xylariaceae sp. FL0255]|nr:oxidoreductase-like protein [Xylariaceae sp. FL0255]